MIIHAVGDEPPFDNSPNLKLMREQEYPPMEIYLDAQVKKSSKDPLVAEDGAAQEAKYLADCLAIKATYPNNV